MTFMKKKSRTDNCQTMKTTNNKNHILPLLFLLLILTTQIGCKTEVIISGYLDKNLPLNLTQTFKTENSLLSTTNTKQILPNSDKFLRLVKWCDENKTGWQETYASFISNLTLTQNSFKLLVLDEAVVIGFIDKQGKSKQYSKTIKKDDLKFLTN